MIMNGAPGYSEDGGFLIKCAEESRLRAQFHASFCAQDAPQLPGV